MQKAWRFAIGAGALGAVVSATFHSVTLAALLGAFHSAASPPPPPPPPPRVQVKLLASPLPAKGSAATPVAPSDRGVRCSGDYYNGIGLQMQRTGEGAALLVLFVGPKTPAERASIHVDDTVLSPDISDLANKYPVGTKLRLQLRDMAGHVRWADVVVARLCGQT